MLNRISDYFETAPEAPRAEEFAASGDLEPIPGTKSTWFDDFVRANPGIALAGAVALGVALAWWIKRR